MSSLRDDSPNEINRGSAESKSSVSPLAAITSLILVAIFAIVIQRPQLYVDTARSEILSTYVPSIPGIGFILCLLLVNVVARQFTKRNRFSQADLIIVYVVTMVGCTLAQNGFFRFQFGIFGTMAQAYILGEDMSWFSGISEWLIPRSGDHLTDFILGGGSVVWTPWIFPIILWTSFAVLSIFVMICAATIVRRRWTEHERLQYPLVLPIANLIRPESALGGVSFWQNKLAYFGMAIPVIYLGSGILHRYFPLIPQIVPRINFVDIIDPGSPFHIMASFPPGWYMELEPLLIGIGYIMPTSITIGSVFWYYIDLLSRAFWQAVGVMGAPWFFPRVGFWGSATLVYGFTVLWVERKDIKAMIRDFVVNRNSTDDENEPLPYRVAFIGGIVGFILLVAFLRIFLGVHVIWAVVYMLVTMLSIIGFAKVRASSGIPVSNPLEWTDVNLIGSIVPFRVIGGQSLVGMAHMIAYHAGALGSGAIMALEGYKLGDSVNLKRRLLTKLILFACVLSVVVSFLVAIPLTYEQGWMMSTSSAQSMSYAPIYTHVIYHLRQGDAYGPAVFTSTWWVRNLWQFVTVAIVPILTYLNMQYVWWPLHPVGYVLACEVTTMARVWPSFLLAGMVKLLIMRYGGYQLYQKITPVALGMIVGSAVMSGLSVVLAFLFGA